MTKVLLSGIAILTWMLVTDSYAGIYKYVNEEGIILFTNIPKNNSYEKVVNKSPTADRVITSRYSGIISRTSSKYNIDSSLIEAIISVESVSCS
jgi:soluble lytic murein transglycosylase-like protein